MDPMLLALVALTLVGLGAGVLLGRRSSEGAERARRLEAELEAQRAALERAQAEKLALGGELERAREEAQGYRERVVEHFYGTSEQLQALTLRYRELFEHLAEGARTLCPEAAGALEAGLAAPALGAGPDGAGAEVPASDPAAAEPPRPQAARDEDVSAAPPADAPDEEPAEEESLASEGSERERAAAPTAL